MSVTPEKECPGKNTAGKMNSPTNNVPLLRKFSKFPKMGNKPHYKGSEATETNNSHCEKDTEKTEYKETSSTMEDYDILVDQENHQKLILLHSQNKAIQFTLKNMFPFDEKRLKKKNKILKFSHPKNGTVANIFHFKNC